MSTFIFKPNASAQFANWSNPSSWTGGAVPNSADADVDFPTVTETSTGYAYTSYVQILAGESFSVHSIQLRDVLLVTGSLSVGGQLTQYSAGEIDMSGGTITAGSLTNDAYDIQGYGTISAGTLTNNTLILGDESGLVVNATTLINSGTLGAASGGLTVNVTPGGLFGLAGGTLSSGALEALKDGILLINAGSVISVDAATITLGGGTILSRDPGSGQDMSLVTSLQTIASSGNLIIQNSSYHFAHLDIAGALTLETAGQITSDQLVIEHGGHLQGDGTVNSAVVNNGVISVGDYRQLGYRSGADLTLNGAITGDGDLEIAAGKLGRFRGDSSYSSTLEINAPASQNVYFDNGIGVLHLDKPTTFTGAIATVGAGDQIIVQDIALSSITSFSYSGNSNGGTLTLQQASGAASFNFIGNYSTSSFTLAAGPQPLSSDPPSLIIAATPQTAHRLDDFNGDGNADLLWRNVDGSIATWRATGAGQLTSGPFYGHASTDWHILGTFDFDGDGRSDILWRNDSGAFSIWTAQPLGFNQSAYVDSRIGNDWSIVGTGDLNGDGKGDLLWRYQDGTIQSWYASSSSLEDGFQTNTYSRSGIGNDWKVETLADFNGDGKSDILWRNDNGAMSVWTKTDAGFAESSFITAAVSSAWHIEGAADITGDGRADIVWRNDDGTISTWASTGNGFSQLAFFANPGSSWHIDQLADINGDGKADIVWRNDDGTVYTWQSTGAGFDAGVFISKVDASWAIQAHDFV